MLWPRTEECWCLKRCLKLLIWLTFLSKEILTVFTELECKQFVAGRGLHPVLKF